MAPYACIEKELGETPLSALERFRSTHPDLSGVPLTYAGRLDPMAEGKLLILIGKECKKRGEYDVLEKTYEFEVLLGFESDSLDILGVPRYAGAHMPSAEDVARAAASLVGSHTLAYPAYSAKPVGGKPLFVHAREGTLNSIEIPTKEMCVHTAFYRGIHTLPTEVLKAKILERIGRLTVDKNETRSGADFRKEEILERWRMLEVPAAEHSVLRFEAAVSSGTYIRSLSALIAARLGTCGLAYSIRRTRIGTLC